LRVKGWKKLEDGGQKTMKKTEVNMAIASNFLMLFTTALVRTETATRNGMQGSSLF
jgi:hypothetical protein